MLYRWCKDAFRTAPQLVTHVKKDHPGRNVYHCEHCNKGFDIKGTLDRYSKVILTPLNSFIKLSKSEPPFERHPS